MNGSTFTWHERTVAEDQTRRDAVLSPVEIICGRRAVERFAGAALSPPRVAPGLPRTARGRRGVALGLLVFPLHAALHGTLRTGGEASPGGPLAFRRRTYPHPHRQQRGYRRQDEHP